MNSTRKNGAENTSELETQSEVNFVSDGCERFIHSFNKFIKHVHGRHCARPRYVVVNERGFLHT